MATATRRPPPWVFAAAGVGLLFVLAVGVGYHAWRDLEQRRDFERFTLIEEEHRATSAAIDGVLHLYKTGAATGDWADNPRYKGLVSRLAELEAEADQILARHPSWDRQSPRREPTARRGR
jgi:hypothetical protein